MSAHEKQVGGNHYKENRIQPWDVIDEYDLDFYEGNTVKYVLRKKGETLKDRIIDLQKAQHYLEKKIELLKYSVNGNTAPVFKKDQTVTVPIGKVDVYAKIVEPDKDLDTFWVVEIPPTGSYQAFSQNEITPVVPHLKPGKKVWVRLASKDAGWIECTVEGECGVDNRIDVRDQYDGISTIRIAHVCPKLNEKELLPGEIIEIQPEHFDPGEELFYLDSKEYPYPKVKVLECDPPNNEYRVKPIVQVRKGHETIVDTRSFWTHGNKLARGIV